MRNMKLSGTKARRWRKEVASHSKQPPKYVRTLKFPLELSDIPALSFDSVSALFNVTEGIGKGTLAGALCATHLTGFRFFGNTARTATFRNMQQLPTDEFRTGWRLSTNEPAGDLTPATLINFLSVKPRKVGGRKPDYDNKPIASDLLKLAAIETDENEPNDIHRCLSLFENLLREEFPERAQISSDIPKALKLFDSAAATSNMDLPSLEQAFSSFTQPEPATSSIAFDSSLQQVDIGENVDVLFHQVVAQKLRWLGSSDGSDLFKLRKNVQAEITTLTNNALSWLFGKGLVYWQKTALDQILLDYDIPESNHDKIKKLQDWFIAIPKDSLFGRDNYSDFRTSVGQKLNSWIANYLNRLQEIKDILFALDTKFDMPEVLFTPASDKLFSGLGVTANQLQTIFNNLHDKHEAQEAFKQLAGTSIPLPSESDIEIIELFSEQLDAAHGLIEILLNRIEQDIDSADSTLSSHAKLCKFEPPAWLKALPRINRISGGIPPVEDELDSDSKRLMEIRTHWKPHVDKIIAWATDQGVWHEPIIGLAEQELDLLRKRGAKNLQSQDGEIQAKRKILHRLTRLAVNGDQAFKLLLVDKLSSLFVDPKNLNVLLFNNRGSVYRSPFSTSRHEAYPLNPEKLLQVDLMKILEGLVNKTKAISVENPNISHYRDWVRMEALFHSFKLSGLPEEVPVELLEIDKITQWFHIPSFVTALLNSDNIHRETLQKVMNLYSSEISGILARLFRSTFTIKTKFIRVDKNELSYVPKARTWTPPSQYLGSTKPIGQIFTHDGLVKDGDGILPIKSLPNLYKAFSNHTGLAKRPFTSYLKQAPHDWFVDLELNNGSSNKHIDGLGMGKEGLTSISRLTSPCRLVGASSYKEILDSWITDSTISLGDYNLIIMRSFSQTVSILKDGDVSVSIEPLEVSADLALSITDDHQIQTEEHPLGKTVIGIDLGEAGIGYSVFNSSLIDYEEIQHVEPIASGTIPIRSIRRLIKQVQQYRKRTQPKQRFQQRFNNSLELMRHNVLGDVSHEIEGLCAKFQGFPVLETSVVNLASGSAQLKLVYDKIVHRYFFSDIDAHKTERKHHWCGGENWSHPSLQREVRKQSKNDVFQFTGKFEVLPLFPGQAVHPAGTSQICSSCGMNPYKVIDKHFNSTGDKSVNIQEEGQVALSSGDVLVLKRQQDPNKKDSERRAEARQARRRKETLQYRYYETPGKRNQTELKSQVRRQLRQPQQSTRSKDTTQSMYKCIFLGCQNSIHADENAAINIVRKWVLDRHIKSVSPP